MVADSLRNITRGACVKKRQGQSEQFAEEICDHGHAHPRTNVQEQPAADHVSSRLAQRKDDLGGQQDIDEVQVKIANALIDDGLRKKRQDQFNAEPDQHPQKHLGHQTLVRMEIPKKEASDEC